MIKNIFYLFSLSAFLLILKADCLVPNKPPYGVYMDYTTIYKLHESRAIFYMLNGDAIGMQRTKALLAANIKDPRFYFEYHHNFMVANEHLENGIDCTIRSLIDYHQKYRFNENFQNECLTNIENCKKGIHRNFEKDSKVRDIFRKGYLSYEISIQEYKKPVNPNIFYDHAFIEFTEGNEEEAAYYAEKYLLTCKEQNLENDISTDELVLLGSAYLELADFNKAIEYLSEALAKDHTNKAAFFNRSVAYFEKGEFDLALADYLNSGRTERIPKSVFQASSEFTQAFLKAAKQGIEECAVDFVPSLCNTAYGIGTMLWTTVQHPIDTATECVNACYEMGVCAAEYGKNINWDTIDEYAYEFREFCDRFTELSETQKGELIGYTIGKYGVDALAGGALLKGTKALRNLKNTNRLCNLEAMALSATNKEAVIANATRHATQREKYFNNVKIQWDKQNKHIQGKHNFIEGRGTITIEAQELERLIKTYVGTGQKVIGDLGQAGYKERVDFGRIIGEYAVKKEGQPVQFYPTSKGIITHAKDGTVHVYPTNPGAILD